VLWFCFVCCVEKFMILRDYWFGCCFGSMRDMVVTLATVMLEKKV
jgi:hypothetical protein